MLFQFHLNVRVAGISSSTFKLLDAVLGGEGGGQQLGENEVDLGDKADGTTLASSSHGGGLVLGSGRSLSSSSLGVSVVSAAPACLSTV